MYVITGGAGFIGSALLWQLNSLGIDDVLIVDNLASSDKWRNLVKRSYADYMHRDRFLELSRGNSPLLGNVRGVVHLGACSSTTEADADFLMENNFHYSRDVCRFALNRGARFINASSAATYGNGEYGFCDSHTLVPHLRPLNMYGYSKQLMDLWILRQKLESSVASLKFFNVYGPNEYHKGSMRSVAAKIFGEIGASNRATLFASGRHDIRDGEQTRDFVYVKDCGRLLAWLLLEREDVCGIRNVGTGQARSFNDLARAVFSAMDREPQIVYTPMPEAIAGNYQYHTRADMKWLENEAYPYNFCSIEDGISDYVRKIGRASCRERV